MSENEEIKNEEIQPEKPQEEVTQETPVEEVTPEVPKEEVTEEAPVAEVVEEVTPVVEEVAEKAAPKVEKIAAAPSDDFDWDAVETKGFGQDYSNKEKEDLTKMYEDTLIEVQEREVVTGTVVGISHRDLVLNIGFKSDGIISASEFRDMKDLKIGDEVEVYIEQQENANGQLVLSRKKAKIVGAWKNINDAYENDTVIDGFVKRRTKGGLIIDIYGVEAFLPGSQIDVKPIRDFDIFVDKSMEVKVVKINYENDNVVVSHKVLIEKDLEKQKIEILNNLEKGQVLEGVIKNMTNFGVFIDLGGVDGLLHITDISWARIGHPEEVLNLDEKVNIVVLDFDENKKRISLGMKQLTPHPWDSLSTDLEIGSKVNGRIVNVADYGAFLELHPGVEGLIHVSEMSWSQHLRNPQDFIKIGDKLETVILTLDREDKKMSLGIKQLSEDPWTKKDVLKKYAIGTKHTGIVRNLTSFGLFIELEEGIDGLVHVSDLSWTKKVKHPSEFVKVGENLEVMVLELDVDNRRLALGHKQLEENPWDTFESVFEVGSVHTCTITSKHDKGGVLELPYGIEGFATARHLVKEDGSKAENGETLSFKVLEFSKDDKRILMSHTNTHAQVEEAPKKAKKAPAKAVKKKEADMSTLGDLDVLANLKSKMTDDAVEKLEKKEAAKKEPKKVEEEAPKAAKKPAAKKATKKEDKGDDLTKVEGIGPKIAGIFVEAGINSFADLASADLDKLKELLAAAGSRYKSKDPQTWPEQAKMAADGKWDELKVWQDEHDGGRAK